MNEKPTMLEGAFDLLSRVPYLKRFLQTFWIIQTAFVGVLYIIEISAVFTNKIPFRATLTRDLTLYLCINPFFAWIFYLWTKREKSKN